MREKKEINIQIGEQVKKAREQASLTQEQLAEQIEVSPQYVSDLERGVVGISIPTLKKLCSVLYVTSDQILFADRPENDVTAITNKCGMLPKEQFDILSARLHANIMASREAVTRGWMASKSQVGISGRSIAPTIYVACGISGAVQHMLGVQEAKYIIAINNNMDAPIFNYASLGLVGDIKEVLPAILEIIHIDSTVLSGGNQ